MSATDEPDLDAQYLAIGQKALDYACDVMPRPRYKLADVGENHRRFMLAFVGEVRYCLTQHELSLEAIAQRAADAGCDAMPRPRVDLIQLCAGDGIYKAQLTMVRIIARELGLEKAWTPTKSST